MFSEDNIIAIFEHYGIDTTDENMDKLALVLADLFQQLEEKLEK